MAFPLDYDLNEEINGLINEYNAILNEYSELRTFYNAKKNNLNEFSIHTNKKVDSDIGLIDNGTVQDVNECKAMAENLSGNAALFRNQNNECSVVKTFPLIIDNNDNYDSIIINQDYILSMMENLIEKLDTKNDIINAKLENIDDTDLMKTRAEETENLNKLIAEYENLRNTEQNYVNREDLDELTNVEKLSELNTKSYYYWFYLAIIFLLIFILIIINISIPKGSFSLTQSSNVSDNSIYYIGFSIILVILFAYFYNNYRL